MPSLRCPGECRGCHPRHVVSQRRSCWASKREKRMGLNSRVLYGPGLRHIITFHRSLLECSHVAYLMQRSLGNVAVFTRRRGNAGDQPAISATGSKGRMVITGKWQPPQVEKIPIGLSFRWSSQKILIPNYSFDRKGECMEKGTSKLCSPLLPKWWRFSWSAKLEVIVFSPGLPHYSISSPPMHSSALIIRLPPFLFFPP